MGRTPAPYRYLHVGDDPGAVARAVLIVQHLDLRVVVKGALSGLLHGDLRHDEVLVQHGAGFPGQAPDGQAVRAVGQDLEVDDVVAEAEDLLDVGAGLHVLEDLDDALVADVGVQARGHVQLGAGAQHAHGHLATHLALLDLATRQVRAVQRRRHAHALMHVGRAANDLYRLSLAHIHHADVQVVRIGVIHAAHHVTHDHLVELRAGLLDALDAGAGHDHAGGVVLRAHVDVHIFLEPLHGHFHILNLRFCHGERFF